MSIPLLIAAVVLLVTLWRPRFGLAAVILLWPSYLLRTTLVSIPTTALELSLYAVTLGLLVLWFIKRLSWHWVHMTRWTWWLLVGWVFAWVIATVFSPDKHAALGAFKAWLVDPLLFAALLAFLVRTEEDRRFVIQATIISGALVAVFGLYQILWLPETLQQGRLSSFFHPVANYAAMFLVPIFVVNGALLRYRYIHGAMWWASFGLMVLAIILTMSYGGFFAIAAAAAFLWLYVPSGKIKRRLPLVAIVIGLIAALALSTTRNFSEHFNLSDRSSGLVRQQIWVTSWSLIQQHPLLGIGPNNFEAAYRTEVPRHYFPPLEWLVAQPHNLYLALWLEVGLLGLLAFLAPVARHFLLLRRAAFSSINDSVIAIVSSTALVAILVHGLVDTPYFKNDLAMEYMFFAVLPWLGGTKPRWL